LRVKPTSPLQFTVVRSINAGAAKVFDVLTSESGMKAWIPLCRCAEWRHQGEALFPGVGSIRHIVLVGGLVAAERIVGWEAGRELQYTFDQSSLPLSRVTDRYLGISQIESIDATSSCLRWSVYFDVPEGLKWLTPALRSGLRSVVGLMASRLKNESEKPNR
jgi:Polyketide cyclase / dehydrase and lipid transport